MRANDSGAAAKLVIDQKSKLTAVTVERAEPVGNADEAIAADGIADRQYRSELHTRNTCHHIGFGGCARTDPRCCRSLAWQE